MKKVSFHSSEELSQYISTNRDSFVNQPYDIPMAMVTGKGSTITTLKEIQGRAKRKTITDAMILSLIDVAKRKKANERVKAYWNTYHCQRQLISHEGTIYGNYCKNRFCTLCCSIRKAVIVNKYLPIIKTWSDPHFVTLTIKACPARNLKIMIDGLYKAFGKIRERQKKRHQRGGKKLIGIKSVECNFNPQRRTYNPHIHLIVPDQETAKILIVEWLKLWTPKFARPYAQHHRRVKDEESDLIEIVKYGSKIFTESDIDKKSRSKKPTQFVYVSALDNIFKAMKGHRIFDRFGFNLPRNIEEIKPTYTLLNAFREWKYKTELCDWVNVETGERMSGYVMPLELENLLRNRRDIVIE